MWQSAGATPESLLQKMEEETNVNKYIVTQKLPKEMSSKKKIVESLLRVTNLPALGQNDIADVSVLQAHTKHNFYLLMKHVSAEMFQTWSEQTIW